MMGDIRVKSLEEQVDKLTRRAEKAEARVAEIESHQEDLEVSRSQAVAEKDRYRARVAELEGDLRTANARLENAAKTIRTQRMMRRTAARPSAGTEAKLVEAEARVAGFESAVGKLNSTPPGDWELTCNGEVFHELVALLPDERKEGE